MSLFEKFTNLYELSKTLRFELKPVGNTRKMLEKNKVFTKDKVIDDNYHKIKYYFDILHREFVKESLENTDLSYQNYYNALQNYYIERKKISKSKELKTLNDKVLKEEEKLRKKIVESFDAKADEWKKVFLDQKIKLKQNGIKILFEKDNLKILEKIFQKKENKIYFTNILTGEIKIIEDENIPDIELENNKNLFDSFDGFQGYLTNFHQSRKNFYSERNQTTAISNRAINENLRRFCDNLKQFEDKKEEYEKVELTEKEVKIFDLDFYNKCLIQDGIDDHNYIIGGKNLENGEKIQGINEKINLYNQKNKDKKLRQFKSLYKQILSPKEQRMSAEIEKDDDVFIKIREFIVLNEKKIKEAKQLFFDFIDHQEKYVINEIYLKGAALNTISSRWFASWMTIGEKIMTGKSENKKFPDFISFGELKKQFDAKNTDVQAGDLFKSEYEEIYKNSSSHYETFLQIWKKEFEENLLGYCNSLHDIENMIIKDKIYTNKKEKRSIKNKAGKIENVETEIQKEKIKNYADSALSAFQMMKYFSLEKGKKKVEDNPQDQNFYNVFNEYYYGKEDYNLRFVQIYNGLRNYLTKKPFRTDKIKLNFENSTLLDGWDKNKESDNFGVILRKDGKYYLGLMKSNSNKIFDKIKNGGKMGESAEKGFYEKMVYKFIKDATLSIPKATTQTKEVVSHFKNNTDAYNFFDRKTFNKPIKINQDIFELNNKIYLKSDLSKFIIRDKTSNEYEKNYIKSFQKEYLRLGGSQQVYKNSLRKWIDFCKDFLASYKSCDFFNYSSIKASEKYASVDEFYKDVNRLSYKNSFENVSEKYIDEKIAEGELYLFQIYNKDFAKKHNGLKNLHTIYWENIFTKENEKNPIFKLNGQAEIFFRPKSIQKEIDKKRNTKITITKNKRYTEDKYLFHCPIKLNFACHNERVNNKVIKAISETDKIRLIGIDRGEKHLLYLSVIDLEGNIYQMKSLNVISAPNKQMPVDYHKLLDDKEKGRDEARKSWQNIENIRELKEGYISQVVNEISKIIFDCFEKGEFPMIVFEDLNIGFKQGRFRIEKQVYQKFELALAKKLNYLINKAKANQRETLQLTPPIGNFQDIYRQTGIIFYIPASFTSAICPVCGFRKRLKGFYFENKIQAINLLKDGLQELKFDGEKFLFTMKAINNYNNKKSKKENSNELFTNKQLLQELSFHSAVERLINTQISNTKKWKTEHFIATDELKEMFGDQIAQNENLKEIVLKDDFNQKELIRIINIILKLRNSITITDNNENNDKNKNRDFIACPACGFHSEKNLKSFYKKYLASDKLQFNGDANGAYNIARKGILVVKKIKQFAEKNSIDKIKFEHLTTNMEEWDKFVQK